MPPSDIAAATNSIHLWSQPQLIKTCRLNKRAHETVEVLEKIGLESSYVSIAWFNVSTGIISKMGVLMLEIPLE